MSIFFTQQSEFFLPVYWVCYSLLPLNTYLKLNHLYVSQENMFNELVYVSYISSEESCIFVQVESIMFQYLQCTVNELSQSEEITQLVVTSLNDLDENREEIFLAQYEMDGVYYRARILDVNPLSQNVSTYLPTSTRLLINCNFL